MNMGGQESARKKHVALTPQANAFIYAQPVNVIGEFLALIDLLEIQGTLAMPQARAMGDGLYELRVKVDRNAYRGFYCYAVGNLIWLLCGFIKKTAKTPLREIRKAKRIRKELGL